MKKQIILGLIITMIITLNLSGCAENKNSGVYQFTFNEKNIHVTTDKETYWIGEKVNITISNNLNEPLFIGGWSGCDGYCFIVLKYENNKWIEFPSYCGPCEMYIGTTVEAFENITLVWNQEIFSNNTKECNTFFASAGLYKFKIQGKIENTNFEIFSNNITIWGIPNMRINTGNLPNELWEILLNGTWVKTGEEGCIICHACDICSCIAPNVWTIDNKVTISIKYVSCRGSSYIINYNGTDYYGANYYI